jgi:hypothetical protein
MQSDAFEVVAPTLGSDSERVAGFSAGAAEILLELHSDAYIPAARRSTTAPASIVKLAHAGVCSGIGLLFLAGTSASQERPIEHLLGNLRLSPLDRIRLAFSHHGDTRVGAVMRALDVYVGWRRRGPAAHAAAPALLENARTLCEELLHFTSARRGEWPAELVGAAEALLQAHRANVAAHGPAQRAGASA